MDYADFIAAKHFRQVEAGFDHVCTNPRLFDYQKATVEWALRRGLKESYFALARRNLDEAENVRQEDLFSASAA